MFLAANLSMMFTELPLAARFAAAADAGFSTVEIQFPYDTPIDELVRARDGAGVEVGLINVPAGDLPGGDVGLTALPDRRSEYRDAVAACVSYARRLGVTKVNTLAGRPGPGHAGEAVSATLTENLRFAGDRFAEIAVTVLVEPVNATDVPGFHLTRLDHALEAVGRADHPNVEILFDLYHMARAEPSLGDAIRRAGRRIGHVQFADTPGRHEPGTGTVDFAAALAALAEVGYDGCLAAEYRPRASTREGLGWMDDFAPWMEGS